MINWAKIDKFYLVFILIMVVMGAVVIFTLKTLFSSVISAYDINSSSAGSNLTVDKDKLNEAYDYVLPKNNSVENKQQ